MARQRNDEDELTRCVTATERIVDDALPPASEHAAENFRRDRTEFRKIAFGMVLRELLDFES